jgi:hypothetical protein
VELHKATQVRIEIKKELEGRLEARMFATYKVDHSNDGVVGRVIVGTYTEDIGNRQIVPSSGDG